jgi:hypothetical protein
LTGKISKLCHLERFLERCQCLARPTGLQEKLAERFMRYGTDWSQILPPQPGRTASVGRVRVARILAILRTGEESRKNRSVAYDAFFSDGAR